MVKVSVGVNVTPSPAIIARNPEGAVNCAKDIYEAAKDRIELTNMVRDLSNEDDEDGLNI